MKNSKKLRKATETNQFEEQYKESCNEKNNRMISIKIFVVGLIIALVLCGIGLVKQNNAKKTNEERGIQAREQSQMMIDKANVRLKEIEQELIPLQEQYEAKQREHDSLNMWDSDWYSRSAQLQREAMNCYSKIADLESEKFNLENGDYRVFYPLVEPITYNIFYYIAAGVFTLLSLIALFYFLITRKK